MSTLLSRFRSGQFSVDSVPPETLVARAECIASTIDPAPEERIAILVPPGADFVSASFGILLAGGVAVVLSPLHPAPETLSFCEDAGVRFVLVGDDPAYRALAAPLRVRIDVRPLASLAQERALREIEEGAAALQLYTAIGASSRVTMCAFEAMRTWNAMAVATVFMAVPKRALTGEIPLERFGMTEIGVGLTNRLDGERFPGRMGFPFPTVETRIVDGEP